MRVLLLLLLLFVAVLIMMMVFMMLMLEVIMIVIITMIAGACATPAVAAVCGGVDNDDGVHDGDAAAADCDHANVRCVSLHSSPSGVPPDDLLQFHQPAQPQ